MRLPRRLQRIIRHAADAVGYEAFPKDMSEGPVMAIRLRHLFERCCIERVVDVGANKGQFRDFLRFDLRFAGPIHSFEPDPDLADALRQRAAREDPLWTISQIALGREAGARTFSRMRHSVYNSFLTPRTGPKTDRENSVAERFEVEVRRLDDLLPELGDLGRTYLKLDTQGFDLEVLAGGRTAFGRAPLAQTEVSFIPIYIESPDWMASMKAFLDAGFMVADFFIVNGPAQGAAWEADLVLIKPEFA
jgi:FkbM family methyltransferase